MFKVEDYLINFYKKKHKYFYSDLNWPSKSRQISEFKILSSIIKDKYYSITDYGSGYGNLYSYLKNKPLQYFGYEINKDFFSKSKKNFKKKKNILFYNSSNIKNKTDYIICSGIFSIKGLCSNKQFYNFLKKIIKSFINNSYKGFSANFHWDICNKNMRKNHIFYSNIKSILKLIPKKIFKIKIIKNRKKKVFYILATRIKNSQNIFVCNTKGTNIKYLIPELKNNNCLLIIFNNIRLANLTLKNKINTIFYYDKKNKSLFNKYLYSTLKEIKHIKRIFIFSRYLISNQNLELKKNKFINLHYSLLPKYKGLQGMRNSIESSDKYIGCTLHYINKEIDSGKIISQKKFLNNGRDYLKKKKIFYLGLSLVKSNL